MRYFNGAIIAGLLAVVLGVTVIVGWTTENESLVRVIPGFAAMQVNSAVGFLLCGFGLISTALGRVRAGAIFGALVGLLGVLTLAQYIFGVQFGIDELIFKVKEGEKARMGPNTALCFLLSGVALFVAGFWQKKALQDEDAPVGKEFAQKPTPIFVALAATGLLGSIITALGLVAFIGYMSGVKAAYTWSTIGSMAVHTAAGFCLVGLGLVDYAWRAESFKTGRMPRWLPLPVAIAIITASICQWQALHAFQVEQIYEDTKLYGSAVTDKVSGELGDWIKGLRYLAHRRETHSGLQSERLRRDASGYLGLQRFKPQSGLQSVKWVNAELRVRWSVPSSKKMKGSDPAKSPRALEEMKKVKDKNRVTISRPVRLAEGGNGYFVYVPISTPTYTVDRGNVKVDLVDLLAKTSPSADRHNLFQELKIVVQPLPKKLADSPAYQDKKGMLISKILPGSPAAKAGLRTGMVILQSRKFLGMVIGVFRMETLLSGVFHDFQKAYGNVYDMAVFARGRGPVQKQIYRTGKGRGATGYEAFKTKIVKYGTDWQLEFWPTHRKIADRTTAVPEIALGGGLLLALLMALAVYLAQKSKVQSDVIAAARDRLEIRVEERTAELRQANADIVRMNMEMDDFAYTTSHDLKAPLVNIQDVSKSIAVSDHLQGDARNSFDQLQENVDQMGGMLDDLLTYSLAGRMGLGVSTVDVEKTVHEIADALALPEGFCINTTGSPLQFEAMGEPFKQVMRNLIENAVVHHDNPATGRVEITIREADGFHEITVADNGPGIPERFHDSIFGIFQTARSHEDTKGTGMGLAIVRKIIAWRGGEISVESEGRGAAFRFTWKKR